MASKKAAWYATKDVAACNRWFSATLLVIDEAGSCAGSRFQDRRLG